MNDKNWLEYWVDPQTWNFAVISRIPGIAGNA